MLKTPTQKLLGTDKFSTVAGYRINIQKLTAFLYINKYHKGNEGKQQQNLFKITSSPLHHQNKILLKKPDQGSETLTLRTIKH